MRIPILATLVVVALGLVACTSGSQSPSASLASVQPSGAASAPASIAPSSAPAELTIYAAASLARALEQVKTAYETAEPGTTLTISTDSSAALATKIEQGAPADVFLSADTAAPRRLVDGGFAAGDVVAFAGNALAIVVPADNPAAISTPADLARDGVKVIAAGERVPITTYAERLVANLAALDGYPAGFADAYAANVVSREDSVSAVAAKVALGEGDAGIVYATDALGVDRLATVAIPDGANVRATYGGIVVGASSDALAAAAFLAWLAGPEGQAVLASFGFTPPS